MRIQTVASPSELVRLVLLLQAIPTAALFFAISAVERSSVRAGEVVRATLAVASGISVLRLIQIAMEGDIGFGVPLPPVVVKGAVALGVVVVGMLLVTIARRPVGNLFATMSPVFVLTTVVFVVQVLAVPGEPSTEQALARDTVVLVVFDELGRDVLTGEDGIDATLFPNLAALADDGVMVTDGTTNYGDTCQAIPALLTGQRVAEEACRSFVVRDTEGSIARDLSSRYAVSVYGEFFRDCVRPDPDLCHGPSALSARYPHKLLVQHYLPLSLREGPLAAIFGRTHPFTRELWSEFIADLEPTKARGRAYIVHVMLPHSPFALDERGALHGSPWQYFYEGPDSDTRVYDNYRLQVRYVDALVGQMVEQLKRSGLYMTSTIVVTGDHGPRALHPVAQVLDGRAAEAPNVPLIIRSPGLAPARLSPRYEHIDLADTLRDILDLPRSATDGRSIFDERPERQRMFRWEERTYILRNGDWRLSEP